MISTAVAGAALLLPRAVLAIGWNPETGGAQSVSAGLSRDTFKALINESFRFTSQSGMVTRLQLVEVWDGPSSKLLEQFGLVFSRPGASGLLPAALYTMHHPETGAMVAHIEPASAEPDSYSACFNWIKKT